MAVASWMIRDRSLRNKGLRGRYENKEDIVKLDYNLGFPLLMREIFVNICEKHGVSSIKKLNYLNAFVELLNRNPEWRSEPCVLCIKDVLCCLRVALIQDSVQVRAAGLRAVRHVISIEEDVICLNNLRYPYLISRSLDLILKTDNERILMSERIQALRLIRHILSVAPQHFTAVLVQPLISVAFRPLEETDRLLKSCLAVLCELCILNGYLFIECKGIEALMRNCNINSSGHISEAICGSLLYLLNKPVVRHRAKLNFQDIAAAYTMLNTPGKTSTFREEERRLSWANITLLSLLRSWCGILHFCHPGDPFNPGGLRSVLQILCLNHRNTRRSILDLLFELIRVPEPCWTDDPETALETINPSRFQDSFKLHEGFIISEAKYILPNISKCRVNLEEIHVSLILYCLLEASLPDILVEVIVNSDPFLSIRATILLGQFLHLVHKLLPTGCYVSYPVLPNLISYCVQGYGLQPSLRKFPDVPSGFSATGTISDAVPHYSVYTPARMTTAEDESDDNKLRLTTNNLHEGKSSFAKSRSSDQIVDTSITAVENIDDNDRKDDRRINYDGDRLQTKSNRSSLRNSITYTGQDMLVDNLTNAEDNDNLAFVIKQPPKVLKKPYDYSCLFKPGEISDNILNLNLSDPLPCIKKQQKALSALTLLSNVHKMLQKPLRPATLILANIMRRLETVENERTAKKRKSFFTKWKMYKHKTLNHMIINECDALIKETGVLVVSDSLKWKWESVRSVLKARGSMPKKLNNVNFRAFIRRLVIYYKPSSKQFSKINLEQENNVRLTLPTLAACDLIDFLLYTDHVECNKLLGEFLYDLDLQFEAVLNSKSIHYCLFSPHAITNTLCQDYFLLIGHLSHSNAGTIALKKTLIFERLRQLATSTNLDCYVKLIVSNLSYVSNDASRKLLCSVMSCSYISSRLYIARFLHLLLQLNVPLEFAEWIIDQLVLLLYDDNNTVSSAAVIALDEAAGNKNYLHHIIHLRPTLLHLGDRGLLLLIRFLSTEEGFDYLQTANFVIPQLQRWGAGYNIRYVNLIEEELHDSLTHYQRGEDGIYRHRTIGIKPVIKNVYVPPHLYGQLAQHAQGFNILLKDENFHKFIQVVLNEHWDTDDAIIELKSALWALGHVIATGLGSKYLSDRNVTETIVKYAEKCPVYSVKATAFYVLSVIATTRAGEATLKKTDWKCLKRRRYEEFILHPDITNCSSFPDEYSSTEELYHSITRKSDSNLITALDEMNVLRNEQFPTYSFLDKTDVLLNRKSATLPSKTSLQPISHFRSLSECKADTCDEWSGSSSPSSTANKLVVDGTKCPNDDQFRHYSENYCTDGSTSGISSSDSVCAKPVTVNEKIQTLSPIPSSSSLATVIASTQPVITHYTSKLYSHNNFSYKPNAVAQNALSYRTLRMLHPNKYGASSSSISASATMNLLIGNDCKQMLPLVRPKIPKSIHEQPFYDFDVSQVSSLEVIDDEEDENTDDVSREHDEEQDANVACYQGICLPKKLSLLFSESVQPQLQRVPTSSRLRKISKQFPGSQQNVDEIEISADSESESTRGFRRRGKNLNSIRKRRHEKQTCLLCIFKDDTFVTNDQQTVRKRKTSTNSVQRIRTETESSYGGGGIGGEAESPVLPTWQLKPTGLSDALGNASAGTDVAAVGKPVKGRKSPIADMSLSQSSLIQDNNSKSRSILRKEVIKLVEQLANPVLYKTCKQGLLQLKQLCGDLFQDVCLYSDVSNLLGTINYRIQARQLVQDLFLDATFYELYEEPLNILNRTANLKISDDIDTRTTNSDKTVPAPSSSTSLCPYAAQSKCKLGIDDRSHLNDNSELNVIVERDDQDHHRTTIISNNNEGAARSTLILNKNESILGNDYPRSINDYYDIDKSKNDAIINDSANRCERCLYDNNTSVHNKRRQIPIKPKRRNLSSSSSNNNHDSDSSKVKDGDIDINTKISSSTPVRCTVHDSCTSFFALSPVSSAHSSTVIYDSSIEKRSNATENDNLATVVPNDRSDAEYNVLTSPTYSSISYSEDSILSNNNGNNNNDKSCHHKVTNEQILSDNVIINRDDVRLNCRDWESSEAHLTIGLDFNSYFDEENNRELQQQQTESYQNGNSHHHHHHHHNRHRKYATSQPPNQNLLSSPLANVRKSSLDDKTGNRDFF